MLAGAGRRFTQRIAGFPDLQACLLLAVLLARLGRERRRVSLLRLPELPITGGMSAGQSADIALR